MTIREGRPDDHPAVVRDRFTPDGDEVVPVD